ncbi:MAG: diaminopimelate epimerase [Edaphocola sp.]
MKLHFFKYQGAGNDFVILDDRKNRTTLSAGRIAHLCNRRFGIGADGLMLLQSTPGADFKMVYFNSDGNESTLCGNGARCIAAFAYHQGIVGRSMEFMAIDGLHKAIVLDDGTVALHMQNVAEILFEDEATILNTGSPHYVQWVNDVSHIDVYGNGRKIRYSGRFGDKGINVNFVSNMDDGIAIRTYERGVEDETLACGTGVTAAAIASVGKQTGMFEVPVKAQGGHLQVTFEKKTTDSAEHIVLTGGAAFVFEGSVVVNALHDEVMPLS